MTKSGETATFTYNSDGLRVKKVCTTTGTTNYILHGKNIAHLTNGSNALHFFYDAQNRPAIVVYNGTAYGYVHNLQDDIIAIVDSAGTKVVEYKYDAWGKPLSKTGSLASTLGKWNPFRYRGYVYDEETNLYYLQSRNYNPDWCRFSIADKYIFFSNQLIALNTYSYCKNNPINQVDYSGGFSVTAFETQFAIEAEKLLWLYSAAGGAAISDSPLPGPGDIVGLGIAGVAVTINLISTFASLASQTNTHVKPFDNYKETKDSYWEATLIKQHGKRTMFVGNALSFQEACTWVAQGNNVLCINQAAAYAIIIENGYRNAVGPENSNEGDPNFLWHYHPTRNHTGYDSIHIWFFK